MEDAPRKRILILGGGFAGLTVAMALEKKLTQDPSVEITLINRENLLILAALVAVGIIVIGCFYLVSPERVLGSFGLKRPASDADTRAWLRLKGIRDVAAGLVVLAMMLTADWRLVGIVLLVEAVIPFGDMSIILRSGGSKSQAFSIHGVTCAVMLVVGLLLIHAI